MSSKKKAAPPCHSGTLQVFKACGVTVYGMGYSRQGVPAEGSMLLDVGYGTGVVMHGITDPRLLCYAMPTVSLPWPDMGVPSIADGFWQALWDHLVREGRSLTVGCVGGHGRTGTALSILAALSGACQRGDPVAWVRAAYCENAVETDEQLKYVTRITRRKVHVHIERATHGHIFLDEEVAEWVRIGGI